MLAAGVSWHRLSHVVYSLVTVPVQCAEFLLLTNRVLFGTPGVPTCSTYFACVNVNAVIFYCSVQDLKANESRLKDINKVANDLESEGLMADEVQAVQQQVCFLSDLVLRRKTLFLSFVCCLLLCASLQDSSHSFLLSALIALALPHTNLKFQPSCVFCRKNGEEC